MIGVGIGMGLGEFRIKTGPYQPPPFPSEISGLKLWLDASDSSTLYQSSGGSLASADGDPVGQWRDKSGNSNHLSQTDGTKKPVVKLAVKNNLPCVRFDGSNDKMALSFTLNQPEFVFAVFSCKTNGAQAWDGATQDYMWGWVSTTTFETYAGAYGPKITNFSLNNFCLIEALYNGASSEIFMNGVSGGTGNVGAFNAGGFTIGGSAGNFSNQNMDVCEILIYQAALGSVDRKKVEAYLSAKWSVY